MKKLFALMLALMLCLGTCCAVAEEDIAELYWEDFEPIVEESGLAGDFVEFEDLGIIMFLPDALEEQELTEEEKAAGYYAKFMSANNDMLVMMFGSAEGVETLEDLAEVVVQAGYTEVQFMLVNDYLALTYARTTDDGIKANYCVFEMEGGEFLQFTFASADANFEDVALAMVASIMDAEE